MDERKALLENAAKAVGMVGYRWSAIFGMSKMIDPSRPDETGTVGPDWNPLADDGDAFRLAVKLRIGLDFANGWSVTYAGSRMSEQFSENQSRSDPYAATRRAITRAAAEIGKAME